MQTRQKQDGLSPFLVLRRNLHNCLRVHEFDRHRCRCHVAFAPIYTTSAPQSLHFRTALMESQINIYICGTLEAAGSVTSVTSVFGDNV